MWITEPGENAEPLDKESLSVPSCWEQAERAHASSHQLNIQP